MNSYFYLPIYEFQNMPHIYIIYNNSLTITIDQNDNRRHIKFLSRFSWRLRVLRRSSASTPQRAIISHSASEADLRLTISITNLCNFMLLGKVIEEACPYIYGTSLYALTKKDIPHSEDFQQR